MFEPIEANYVADGADWAITVTGLGKKLTARAAGLIAARDMADQLAERIADGNGTHTVVHLIDGDAVKFTTAYLNARLVQSGAPAEHGVAEHGSVNGAVEAGPDKDEEEAGTGADGDPAGATREGAEQGQPGKGEERPEVAGQQASN